MKKKDQDTKLLSSNIDSSRYLEEGDIKTTNINILLNRVKLDKKKTFKKKIFFTSILVFFVISIAFIVME